jgi:quercetin dioxygenase-like cupin family protein
VTAFNTETTFVGWDGQGGSTIMPVSPDFWQTLGQNPKARGTLISAYTFEGDWTSWERHPKGDEMVVCIAGEMTMLLEKPDGVERVALKAGDAVIVPANTWHTTNVPAVSRGLFITYGEGTDHRPR